jgi:RNA polymerase sigma-70 factor (ECF subfamily)
MQSSMDNTRQPTASGPVMISDAEIISRVLTGERNLYAQIVRRYNARLYRVAMSIVNDDAEAEEVMQVAYIKAYENLSRFAFRSSFSTWLTRILINESLLCLKKRKQSVHQQEAPMMHNLHTAGAEDAYTPVSQTLQTELRKILEAAIRNLPEIYRTVFIMREIEDMNVLETQECLDISEANVKVRLNRAKSMLRASLQGYYQKEDILHFHLSRCDRMVEWISRHIENH